MIPVSDTHETRRFGALAARIRRSSNFRVAWQLFELEPPRRPTARSARAIFDTIALVPEFQTFLADSYDSLDESVLEVHRLESEAVVREASREFERTVARAATDRLGAHSASLTDALPDETAEVGETFGGLGAYVPFQLQVEPVRGGGPRPRCAFSNWFYGVAWDWCYCVLSQDGRRALVWCMTDTD